MVYIERAETAAVLSGYTTAVSKYTTSVDIEKRATKRKRKKKLFTHVESHASAVSLLESGEQRYIKAINNSFTVQSFKANVVSSTHLHKPEMSQTNGPGS